MSDTTRTEFSLQALAARTGVASRTIRLYIATGLLPGPLRGGRCAAYGPEHASRLEEIRSLQREGLTLREIARRLAAPGAAGTIVEPTPWLSFGVSPDVVVLVREDVSPWRMREIRGAVSRMSAQLDEEVKRDRAQRRTAEGTRIPTNESLREENRHDQRD